MSTPENPLESRVEALENKIDTILQELKGQNEFANTTNKLIDNNFEILNQKLESLRSGLSDLHIDANKNFKEVKLELIKINDVTRYSDHAANLSLIKGGGKKTA